MNSLKKGEGVPLLNFEGSPGVPLLNFRGVLGPGSQGPGVLVPLLHHAFFINSAQINSLILNFSDEIYQ